MRHRSKCIYVASFRKKQNSVTLHTNHLPVRVSLINLEQQNMKICLNVCGESRVHFLLSGQ